MKGFAGYFDSANGAVEAALRGRCATDVFTISYATSVPSSLCGTLTGDHGEILDWINHLSRTLDKPFFSFHYILIFRLLVYFDANQACHDLTFNLGQSAQGLSSVETSRKWSIKVCFSNCSGHMSNSWIISDLPSPLHFFAEGTSRMYAILLW